MPAFDEDHTILSSFIVLISIILFTFSSSSIAESRDGAFSNRYIHDRGDEIHETCAHFLASSSTIEVFDGRVHRTKNELAFYNGDWEHGSGGASLMPPPLYSSSVSSNTMKLASFKVDSINRHLPTSKYMRIGATLLLETSHSVLINRRFSNSRERSFFSRRLSNNTTGFRFLRGRSQLFVSFQGIYTENSGERTLCLLGETDLPLRQLGSPDPWKLFVSSHPHPVLPDDRILLVLRYPTVFSLISRSISGEMHSLNPRTSPKFFDRVSISSQLSKAATYEFGSEHILSKACDPYPFRDNLISPDINIYKGTDFCNVLRSLNSAENGAFTVLPNWRCTGTYDFCRRLGPFASGESINSTNGGFQGVKLLLQDFRCVSSTHNNEETTSASVSAVFRAVSPPERVLDAARRTGVGNTTLSVEGFWKSDSGQLCMVGCSTIFDEDGGTCNSRISLYISFSFSIHHRSTMFGTIRSIDSRVQSHFPLSFEKHMKLSTALVPFLPHYHYSKIDSAGAVLERHEPFSFGTVIKTSLLTFPRLGNPGEHMYDLHLLSRDLTLHLSGISNSSRFNLMIQIISIGWFFGRDWRTFGTYDSTKITEKQLLLNVSAEMTIDGKEHSNFSSLSLEGIYDSHLGKMYLIGCRDARASWSILHESMDLEDGLDCLIEVVVSYPPTNSHGLMNPTASISIASQRNVDDPLNFPNVDLKVSPVVYINQQKDVLLRKHVEGALRIFTLSIALSSVLSQLYYITLNSDSAPYISLVMLFVEAAGYSIPLVTGAEAILKKNYDKGGLYSVSKSSQWLHTVDYMVNVLLLLTLVTTLRLSQKVWKSRARLRSREGGSTPSPVLGERLVLVITVIAHVVGYGAVLGFRFVFRPMSLNPSRNSGLLSGWKTELVRYLGLVQDLFLLPQIIGNIAWNVVCKPLRPTFFIGITFVRILPHAYDFVVIPSFDDQYSIHDGKFVDTGFDFYSKFDDVLIPLVALLLALMTHIQQKWDLQMVKLLGFGEGGIFHSASKEYQMVGTDLCESELISTTRIDEGGKEATTTK